MPAPIHIFTKPDCPHCARANEVLEAEGLSYTAHDITADADTAARAVYLSGLATVPQIFIGETHVTGARDLVRLHEAGRLRALVDAAVGDIDPATVPASRARDGARDILLRDVIPESDGTRSEEPDEWPILRFYKEFFGFWPNCFAYMHHWPEAYKLFVYAHNRGAIGLGREVLGAPVMMATGFATSNAGGCDYCQVHMTAAAGGMSAQMPRLIEAARQGAAPADSPIGPFELELVDLAADSVTNAVSFDHLGRIRARAGEARVSAAGAEANIMGTAMIASAFGFLNTFNDLTGVDVEPDWARHSEQKAGVAHGRHAVGDDAVAGNLDHDLPQGGPTMDEMMARCDTAVALAGGVEAFLRGEFGLVPEWVMAWPEDLRARHALFYAEVMGDRAHSRLPAELKHLVGRVAAIAQGHDALAATEAAFAIRAGGGKGRAVERARLCFDAAIGRGGAEVFSGRERAALRVGWLSAQKPLTTPHRFIQPAIEQFDPVELVHLFTVCGLAGLVERFCAITAPGMGPEVADLAQRYGLDTDTLAIRYPLPVQG
ncbi:glutaredoxin domain-containing protein [Psychromarinibacter sp. C21-152]|uniref:Glutaredoxin 1 n=1 Tax=Psychromarinibacter sediminicola TaxID=3033385 RepID=A0AAE3NXA9_9RHOB|nr:glutaredoxin domain-containing protein [Psychromarinibacter sediminicola]MDF0603837.1 glutaredoxin domain-containing protein [Psychromarinibacter sediminicola]